MATGHEDDASGLGAKIRRLRKEKSMTLEGLGREAGSSKSYIWELENHNPPRPSAEKLHRIAAALSVTVEYLIDPDERGSPSDKVLDQAFYRRYRGLDELTRARIREIVEVWSKKD